MPRPARLPASCLHSCLQLCATYGSRNASLYDIGTPTKGPCTRSWGDQKWCQMCAPCANATNIAITDMTRHKYQLAVDGYGASYDGTAWKLLR